VESPPKREGGETIQSWGGDVRNPKGDAHVQHSKGQRNFLPSKNPQAAGKKKEEIGGRTHTPNHSTSTKRKQKLSGKEEGLPAREKGSPKERRGGRKREDIPRK